MIDSTKRKWVRIFISAFGSFWFVFAVLGTSVAFAALTFGNALISGDSASRVDSTGTLSIGTASATAVMVGSTTISGNSTIAGPAVFQNTLTLDPIRLFTFGTATGTSATSSLGVANASTSRLDVGAGSVFGGLASFLNTLTIDPTMTFTFGKATSTSATSSLGIANVSSSRLDVGGTGVFQNLTVLGTFSPSITSLTGGLVVTGASTTLSSTTITGNSTNTGPAVFLSTLTIDPLQTFTFGIATGTSATSSFSVAKATTTVLAFTNASGTRLDLSGVGNNLTGIVVANATATQATITNASGTRLDLSGVVNNLTGIVVANATATQATITNASGTRLDLSGVGNNLTGIVVANATATAATITNASTTRVDVVTSLTLGGATTSLTKFGCGTVAWDPPLLATSGKAAVTANSPYATSTGSVLTGAVTGDLCFASFSAGTSTAFSLTCNIPAAGFASTTLANLSTISELDFPSVTLKVCALSTGT